MGYIYIAWDKNKENMSKVGMTTKKPEQRISQTENPDYELFKAYEIDDSELKNVESELHYLISQKYTRKKHKSTGRFSEWFMCKPEKSLELITDFLIEKLSNELSNCNMIDTIKSVSPLSVTKGNIYAQNSLKEKLKSRLQSRKDGTLDEIHIRETIQKNTRS